MSAMNAAFDGGPEWYRRGAAPYLSSPGGEDGRGAARGLGWLGGAAVSGSQFANVIEKDGPL